MADGGKPDKQQGEKTKEKPDEKDAQFQELKELITSLDRKICSKIGSMESKLEEFTKSIDRCTERVDRIEEKVDKKFKELETTKCEMEESVKFCSKQFDDICRLSEGFESQENLKKRIEFLERQILYQESRSRKYNLLIYGLPSTQNDTEQEVRELMCSDLKITDNVVDQIIIQNTHRIPIRDQRKTDSSEGQGQKPDPVIVKFARMKDRELVLRHARNIDRGKKITIRTDLPQHLKKKRAELASIAYDLRKKEKLMTAIKESVKDVWLLTKQKKTDRWTRYEIE